MASVVVMEGQRKAFTYSTEPCRQYAEPSKPGTKGRTPCDSISTKFPGKKIELCLPATERALSGELWLQRFRIASCARHQESWVWVVVNLLNWML